MQIHILKHANFGYGLLFSSLVAQCHVLYRVQFTWLGVSQKYKHDAVP